jgi:hypothetical protein
MLMSFAAAPQMALTQDIASLDSRSTSHSSARAGDLRHRLRALQGQVDRAGRDATEARAAVLRLRADRDRAVMDAIALAKAAAEAVVRATRPFCTRYGFYCCAFSVPVVCGGLRRACNKTLCTRHGFYCCTFSVHVVCVGLCRAKH